MITIILSSIKDFSYLLEVTDIMQGQTELEACDIDGLSDSNHLEIGSWLHRNELKRGGIKGLNTHLKFVELP